ncbi:hypothetical protein ACWIHP_35880, partial [Nocardia fluminea]
PPPGSIAGCQQMINLPPRRRVTASTFLGAALGESEEGIAELLDLTSKQVRQHLATARAAERVETAKRGQLPSSKPDQTSGVPSGPASQPGAGEQGDLRGQSLA